MRTRSSRGSSGRGGRSAAVGVAACGAPAFAVPAAMAAKTSALTKRPSLPLAAIFAGLRLCSSTRRRTAGDNTCTWADGTAAGAGAAGVAVGAGAAGAGAAGAGAAGAATAPSAIIPRMAPTSTVAPSATIISANVPAVWALTSSVTLSVSSSTNGSSTATPSPACFIHLATVASVTDSPRVGTLISVAIFVLAFRS